MRILLQTSLILFIFSSCKSDEAKFHDILKDEWQISKFFHLDKDLNKEGYFIVSFDRPGALFMIKNKNRDDKFVSSQYKFSGNKDTLLIDITKSEDKRLLGNYNVYIDTLGETSESYHIRLTFDSENTYMEAERSKLKHYLPPAQ